jgi:hypothetical protein
MDRRCGGRGGFAEEVPQSEEVKDNEPEEDVLQK